VDNLTVSIVTFVLILTKIRYDHTHPLQNLAVTSTTKTILISNRYTMA